MFLLIKKMSSIFLLYDIWFPLQHLLGVYLFVDIFIAGIFLCWSNVYSFGNNAKKFRKMKFYWNYFSCLLFVVVGVENNILFLLIHLKYIVYFFISAVRVLSIFTFFFQNCIINNSLIIRSSQENKSYKFLIIFNFLQYYSCINLNVR